MISDFNLLSARVQTPLHHKPFHQWVCPDDTLWTEFFRTKTGYLLRFPDLADFQVSADGFHVSCSPTPDITETTTQHLYLNQVLPLAQSIMGKLVFHASAVEIGNSAIAFVAESGRGKSTLAASFAINGFRFLTDDGLVLESADDKYMIFPSHPSIRLWEDSQEVLMPPETETVPALEFTSKSRFLAGKNIPHCDQPRPLQRVYFLGDGSAPTIQFQCMTPAEAHIEWVKHSFLLDVEEKKSLVRQFEQVTQLARQPIYYHLDYPRHFEELTDVRKAIVEHAQ